MPDKLKPCPFCKNDDIKIKEDQAMIYYGGAYYVECQKCRSRSMSCSKVEEAISVWNNRAEVTVSCSKHKTDGYIFDEIKKERERQNEKWGEQNHSMLNEAITPDLCRNKAEFYKRMNERPYFHSWFGILHEEFYEAFAETDPAKQREEMIQVAAVAVAIIECLDRNEAGKK